jgi:hypothetical protein
MRRRDPHFDRAGFGVHLGFLQFLVVWANHSNQLVGTGLADFELAVDVIQLRGFATRTTSQQFLGS